MRGKTKKDCEKLLIDTWNELKDALSEGKVLYNDIDSLLEYTFFKQFNDMFNDMKDDNTIKIERIRKFYRCVNCWTDDFNRFIPNESYPSLSRFNPQDKIFIYLGVDLYNNNEQNLEICEIEKGCMKEIRANEGDEISLCEFIPSNQNILEKKVVDLTIGDGETYDELLEKLFHYKFLNSLSSESNKEHNEMGMKNKVGCVYKISKVLMQIYNKMISEQIFLPVDGLDKEYEYKPFHAFANYFLEQGYAGIFYKSTVSPGNKNLVLFDVCDVITTGNIKKTNVSY